MKPATAHALEELGKVDWFCAVGRGQIPGVKRVTSWMDAVVSCAGPKWESVQRDAVYLHKLAIHDALRSISREERRRQDLDTIREEFATGAFLDTGPYLPIDLPEWDRVRNEITPAIVALVTKQTARIVAQAGLPEIVTKRATWDILYRAMESEFNHVVPESFFAAMGEVYLSGRFPCGWEGFWPEGELVIF